MDLIVNDDDVGDDDDDMEDDDGGHPPPLLPVTGSGGRVLSPIYTAVSVTALHLQLAFWVQPGTLGLKTGLFWYISTTVSVAALIWPFR